MWYGSLVRQIYGLILTALFAHSAWGTGYWEASSSSKLLADDNFALSADSQARVTRLEQFVRLGAGEKDERGLWQLAVQNRFRKHSGEDEGLKTAHQPGLELDWQRELNVHNRWSVSANLLRDKTSANEFLDTEIRTDSEKTRWRRVAAIENSYWWTSRWRTQIELNGEWLDYREAENTGLISYDYLSASPTLFYLVSAQTDVYLSLGFDRFRPAPANTRIQQVSAVSSDTRSFTAGWRYRWDAPHELDLSAGYRHSTFNREWDDITLRDEGGLVQGLYRYQGEQHTFTVRAQRRLSPTSDGRVIEQDTVNLAADYAFSERFRSNFALQWREERQTGTDAGRSLDEVSQEVRAGIDYRIQENHRVGLLIRHRRFEQIEEADSNAVELQWHWQSRKRFW